MPTFATRVVQTFNLADNSVTSAKILDGTIANADIANETIQIGKMDGQSLAYHNFYEDFLTIGAEPWTSAANGDTVGITTTQSSTEDSVALSNASGNANGAAILYNDWTQYVMGRYTSFEAEWRMKIDTLTNVARVFIGFATLSSNEPTSATTGEVVGFNYDGTDMRGRTATGGASTDATGAMTVTLTSYNTFTITWDGTTMTFYLNGVSQGTSTTNITTSVVRLIAAFHKANATGGIKVNNVEFVKFVGQHA